MKKKIINILFIIIVFMAVTITFLNMTSVNLMSETYYGTEDKVLWVDWCNPLLPPTNCCVVIEEI